MLPDPVAEPAMLIVWGLLLTISILAGAAVRFCVVFPRQPSRTALPPLDDALRATALDLESHVRAVASVPHNIAHPEALEAAATYIEATLCSFGYTPVPQPFRVGKTQVRNIEIVIDPPPPTRAFETLVIGAHYDSADDFPGANDNGTGVAALLELARTLLESVGEVDLEVVKSILVLGRPIDRDQLLTAHPRRLSRASNTRFKHSSTRFVIPKAYAGVPSSGR